MAVALDDLSAEGVRAAGGAVERGLEAVADAEEEVDGAARVAGDSDALERAVGLQMYGSDSGGEYTPVDRVGEGFALGEAPPGNRSRQVDGSGCVSGTRLACLGRGGRDKDRYGQQNNRQRG
jgi:hypothetical protein